MSVNHGDTVEVVFGVLHVAEFVYLVMDVYAVLFGELLGFVLSCFAHIESMRVMAKGGCVNAIAAFAIARKEELALREPL